MVVRGVFGVVALCVGLAMNQDDCDGPVNRVPPQAAARGYMQELGLASAVVGVSCAGTDSNCDGYVTCTVSRRLPNESIALDSIQCAADGAGSYACAGNGRSSYATGCKPTAPTAAPAGAP